jgi:alkylresorcinol/alkylpyrone synthase
MRIAAAASALPKHSYNQATILAAIQHHWAGRLENPEMLERLHAHTGVDRRHLALPIEEYPALIERWGDVNNAWIRVSLELGKEAILGALDAAGIEREALGAIFVVSVTGVCSPSLDAKLINALSLSPNIKRVPIFGLGCVAGAAGIARAADYVRAFPDQAALLLSVELCSLTVQQEDFSIANLISSGLFGDGAAAVIVAGHSCHAANGPEIIATRSVFYPQTEGVMGWDISEKGFRIVLTRDVPGMVYKHLAPDIDAFLADHSLSRADIGTWIMHTGGPAILRATADALGVPDSTLAPSWDCLRRVGNLSSASVLFVLEDYLRNRRPPAGTMSVLAAMGPGFCSELVLLRW